MKDKVIIYTDGACKGNPGVGGWGVVILINDKNPIYINGGKLKLTISPPNPVPIMAAGGLLMMPDLAIESLGVSLNHIP